MLVCWFVCFFFYDVHVQGIKVIIRNEIKRNKRRKENVTLKTVLFRQIQERRVYKQSSVVLEIVLRIWWFNQIFIELLALK